MGGFGNNITSFDKMPQINPVSRDSESFYTSEGIFLSDYNPEYLRKGELLFVYCVLGSKTVEVTALKSLVKGEIALKYNYDIKTKQLQEVIQYHGENYPDDPQDYTDKLQDIISIIGNYGLTKKRFGSIQEVFFV